MFSSGTTSYVVGPGLVDNQITVTPTAVDPGATILVDGMAVASGSASSPITINAGTNTIVVDVTSSGGTLSLTYTISVIRDTVQGQSAYVKASNTGSFDGFGTSVAISGDTVVVGVPAEASNATGVNAPLTGGSGCQDDNSAPNSGAVYVFVLSGGVWTQQAYLKASNSGIAFGVSVAISGDTIVVGGSNTSVPGAGAAYVFTRNAGIWSQQAYLTASNPDPDDSFGFSVAISGDTIVVGAQSEDSNAIGVNAPLTGGSGTQDDNSLIYAGAAYVFVRTAGVWSQQAYLKASNTGSDDRFGRSVAISGDTIVVGARSESSDATGVNAPLTGGSGCQDSNSAADSGAAYVFTRISGIWTQQAYLKASNTRIGQTFGASVAISGNTIVVAAPNERSNATGVNAPLSGGSGTQADSSLSDAGAAYVFTRTGGVWSQQAYLKASNTGANDRFGTGVAISGDTIVVGAPVESSNATGINAPLAGGSGTQADNSAFSAGAAYVFTRTSAVWSQAAYLKASNTESGDTFGITVSTSGDMIVVAATTEDSNAMGVNAPLSGGSGTQADNSSQDAGAVYIFR